MTDAAGPPYGQVFIERLNVVTTLFIITARRFRGVKKIYCKQASGFARWFWKGRIHPIPNHVYTRVRDGYFVGVQFEIIASLADRFFSESDRYLRRFFEMYMQHELYPITALLLDYEVMSVPSWERTCILVPATPFLQIVRRKLANDAVTFDCHWSAAGIRYAFRAIAGTCVKLGRAAAHGLRSLVGHRDGSDSHPPLISVYSHRGGKSLRLRTDLFWLDSHRAYPNVIVEVGGDTHVARFSDDVIDELKQREIRVIETHGKRRLYAKSVYWQPGARFVRGVLHATLRLVVDLATRRSEPLGLRWWKQFHRFRYQVMVQERLAYYRSFNVKAELRTGFSAFEEPAHSSALNDCGGLTCTVQHSRGLFPMGYTSTSTFHLYFGKGYENTRLPLRARFSIVNGYPFKTSLMGSEDMVADLKARLRNAGIERSACFLDSYPPKEFQVKFLFPAYQALIQRVLDDPAFGLVIKPKPKHIVVAEILRKEVGPAFDLAEKTGRLIILGWDYYPGIVGRAVDLVVGILNTATLETAILGCPTLHLNVRSFIPALFRPASEHIFDNVADLNSAVSEFFSSESTSRMGKHCEAFIRGADHYDDTDASARIEHLLTRYVDELTRGAAPEDALNRTVREFRERWGWIEFESDSARAGLKSRLATQ